MNEQNVDEDQEEMNNEENVVEESPVQTEPFTNMDNGLDMEFGLGNLAPTNDVTGIDMGLDLGLDF